jgi:hypothetical protein
MSLTPVSGSNTLSTLNGLFKQVYGDDVQNLIPDGVKLYKMIKFVQKDKQQGAAFNQPVILGQEHGVTFAGPNDDAFSLVAPVAGQIQNAQVQGYPKVLRSYLGYNSISRSIGGGPKAFEDATKFLVANMLRSLTKKLEIELLYGQAGYGSVSSVNGNTIYIAASEWASGIWSGAEKMPIDVYTAASSGTKRGSANITAVSLSALSITVDTLPSGTTAGDVIFFSGAYGNEAIGIHNMLSQTGTLFGISQTAYSLFAGNQYNCQSTSLSFSHLEHAIALGVAKGLEGDVTVIVNPVTWADLLTEQAALRRTDSSYSTAEVDNGSKSIKFYGQNGMVAIEPSIFCKQGYAYILAVDEFTRMGSSDVSFKIPGMGENEYIRQLEGAAAVEMRLWTDQAVFTSAPGHHVYVYGIVNGQ